MPSEVVEPGDREGSKAFASRTYPGLRIAWRCVEAFAIAGALAHPVAKLLSPYHWFADILTHFQEPALAATLLAVGVTSWKSRKAAALLAVLAAWQVMPLVRYSGANPVAADPRSSERFRILSANVLWENERYDGLARLIRAERPDAVCLVEFTENWRDGLAEVRAEFPFRSEFPARAKGVALWLRRRPLTLDNAEQPADDTWPLIHATFAFAGEPRNLWVVHPRAPVVPSRMRAGFAELDAIAARVGAAGGSGIVVGDLNTTDGSPHFSRFLKVTGLRDSRLGFGRQGSWPADRPYRLAIDHAFVSDDLAVTARRLGPDIGSDHLPLIVDLAPAAAKKPGSQPSQAVRSP